MNSTANSSELVHTLTMANTKETATMNLHDYDFVVISTSGGKDSQAMMEHVMRLADEQDYSRDQVLAVHADLGRVEWAGTTDLVKKQCDHYGLRLEVVARPQGDLLDHIEARGKFPSPAIRYCTSDHKRGQIAKLYTKLGREAGRFIRVLSCQGMRAQESPARAKLEVFKHDARNSNTKRSVDTWLPIHSWKLEQVWSVIKESGVPHHRAYDLGMPRLSCVFCMFAPKAALMLAGKHNPELLEDYVAVEKRIGHTFKADLSLATIQDELNSGAAVDRVQDWTM